MKRLLILSFSLLFCFSFSLSGQSNKARVFGEVSLGFGQALFFNDMKMAIGEALGGTFDPGSGGNIAFGFYVAPEKWKGLGLGARIHGTVGGSVEGANGDGYIFNYYNLGLSAKYYPLSGQFNRGLYARAGIGFGQFTAKRENESEADFTHQYAIGSVISTGLGYSVPLKKSAISLEAVFEYANRNGTVSGQGDGVQFQSGQIGGNVVFSF